MKILGAIALFGLTLYFGTKAGKWIGKKTTPPDWEPSNNKEDQSTSMFV